MSGQGKQSNGATQKRDSFPSDIELTQARLRAGGLMKTYGPNEDSIAYGSDGVYQHGDVSYPMEILPTGATPCSGNNSRAAATSNGYGQGTGNEYDDVPCVYGDKIDMNDTRGSGMPLKGKYGNS